MVMSGATAHAGRSAFAWPYDTETLPKRGVEIQTWIVETDNQGPAHAQETDVWWETVVGITDQLEMVIPMIFRWSRADAEPTVFTFDRYGGELRYRFADPDPENAPALVPLVRLAAFRNIGDRSSSTYEGDLVLTYTVGRVKAVVDGRVSATIQEGENEFYAAPSAGVSVKAIDDLRLGVESYGEFALRGTHENDWIIVGPDLSWTHGRFWLTANAGIGVKGISAAPRVIWGILF
jgi:hypothetical protein